MAPAQDKPAMLRLDGELDIYRAAQLKQTLLETLDGCASGTALEIDLSAVEGIDTAGVQILLLARKTALQQGRTLRLVAPAPAVAEVLELLNLAARFDIVADAG